MLAVSCLLGIASATLASQDALQECLKKEVWRADTASSCEEDDVLPLLQLARVPHTPAADLWNSLSNRTAAAHAAMLLEEKAKVEAISGLAWLASQGDDFIGRFLNHTSSAPLQKQHLAQETEESKRQTRKRLARQAILAAAMVLVLMSLSVSIQVVITEFVMTGACDTSRSLLGSVGSFCWSGARLLVLPLVRMVRMVPWGFVSDWLTSCLGQRQKQTAILEVFPESVLHEVAGHLPVDALCCMGSASRKMQQLSDNHCSYKSLMLEVVRLRLEDRWARYLRRMRPAEVLQSSESEGELLDELAEVEPTEESAGVVEEAALEWVKGASSEAAAVQRIARELRRFLCAELRKSEGKRETRESQQRRKAMMDLARYAMLVVAWFWFSAEVMDLACVPAPKDPWHVLKMVASPCIFLFILETDREYFFWQVMAGILSLALLMEMMYRGFGED